MWRLILLGVAAVAADDRWSRQTTDRRQGDWIPVAAPGASYHHKGRSVLDSSASGSGSLPSVLTPPLQQHARLLPPPPPDGLFQQAATTGFINNFPGQQALIEKPRQFLPQNNLNNNQQSPFRFKDSPPLTDSTGIPSNLFQVGPQQFTQSSNQQNSQILSAPQFLPPQFIPPPPQRTPLHQFVQFNSPQLLHQNIPFSDFPLPPSQHAFLTQPGNLPLQQQQSLFNQVTPPINQSPGRFSPNITNNYKPELQNDGKDEVQLLYVPVEALRQRGRNFANIRGNKKVEPSNLNQNRFVNPNQPLSNIPIQTSKPFFKSHLSENEQFYKQNQENTAFQSDSPQLHHVIQETTAPQLKYKQTVLPQLLQEQTTYSQLNQQSETVTPSPTIHKYQLDQKQRDEVTSLNNQQFAYEQFQRQQFNPDIVAQGKLETPNQNFFQSQQYSSVESLNNKPEYQQSVTPEQHTTIPPPHQPPLSVYMETNANSKIVDVLTHLKNAKTIPVLDTIGPDSPQVFVGPSNLNPPSGYLKFELPYLSSLDSNRVERKVDKLPFFVAPLNFQPPPGYSKIPFPAPHIGSVVVSNITILKTALHEKPNEYFTKPETSTPSGIQQYSVVGDISSFSPQLPSLVNSLQDERYFPSQSTTTETPTTAAETTTVYTTPYRRTPGRGSHRTTKATEAPTRRPATRQRRPYGRPNPYRASQVVSTTPESVVATTPQQYEQTDEQLNFYTEATTETPQQSFSSQNIKEPVFETNNQNNEQFQLPNNQQIYNQQENINQQQNDQQFNQNYPQGQLNNNVLQGIIPQLEQVQQYFTQIQQQQQYLQGNENPQKLAEPQGGQDFAQIQEQYPNYNPDVSQTPNSPVGSENNNYSPNPFNSDSPQEITTEAEIQKVSSHTSESTTVNSNRVNNVRRDPLRQRYRTRNPYQTTTEYVTTTERERPQNVPRRHKTRPSYTQNVQVVKENYPENFPTNTERLDDQSTERSQDSQFNNYKNDFQAANLQEQQNYQNSQPINENDQFYHQQYSIAQLQQGLQNRPIKTEQESEKSGNNENGNFGQVQFENSTPYFSRETTQPSTVNIHNSQPVYTETSSKYEDNDHATEKPINQQRLTKYSRLRGRNNVGQSEQVNDQQHVQQEPSQNSYEGFPSSTDTLESSSITESEPEQATTPKPPAVRVRGRVRNRQRGNGVRQSTTTEPPNYPIESGLVNNPESHYARRPTHRKPYSDRVSNYNRHSGTRYRNSNAQSNYNNDNAENDSGNNHSSTSEENSGSTTETTSVSRKYNHILNRNVARRPSSNRNVHQTSGTTVTTQSTPLQSETGTTTKYLIRTTRRPVTQVTKLSDGRSRIRRPNKATLTITTTEDPPKNSAEDNFAPSAGSNEVLDQYYPSQVNRNHNENNHNLQYQTPNRNPTKHYTPAYESSTILTPTPFAPSNNAQNLDDYWNQGFTIQQSNSYDFSAESSPATQSTLSTRYNNDEDESEEEDGHYSHKSSSPSSWSNPSRTTFNQDQTPYSSNEQYVAAIRNSKTKTKQSSHYSATGKENQWNEKSKEQDANEQHQQTDSDIYRNVDNNEQYNKQANQEEVIINEDQRPVYKQTEENPEDERNQPENPSEQQLVYTAAEDVIRTKDGFIQRKPVDPVTGKKSGRRRGAWVRVRVHKKPKDVFETAESQNLASLTNNNAIKSAEAKGTESEASPKEYNIPPNHRPTDPYSTDLPQTTAATQSTSTEPTTTTAGVENFQKSITDMIREIIKEEEVEEEAAENMKSQEDTSLNKTITTTISPVLPDEVTENQHITTTTISEPAVTVLPEEVTQVNSVDSESEGVTTIRDEEIQQPESRVLGTSTTTEISLETEICYKGRCVKSKKNKKSVKPAVVQSTPDLESDLMPVE